MTGEDSDSKHTCYGCITDPFLADEVKERGIPTLCSNCGHSREAFSLKDLADRIDEVLQEHFERTPDDPDFLDTIFIREGLLDHWIPDGAPVVNIISDMAGLSEEIAEDVRYTLSEPNRYLAIKEGGEDPYDDQAYYDERSPDDWDLRYGWKSFCDEIMFRERIFPENAEPVLQKIFRDLSTMATLDGTSVVREINPSEDFPIWRARTAQSKEELTAMLRDPAQQLGPPPHSIAEAGRMNQKGIPVFYGALEEETCVAEVRPPVGSQVVLGRFKLLRPVKLLNLGLFSRVYVDVSHFNPDYSDLHGRTLFLRNLVAELSRPIMPRDVEREYLPTQFVASFLARKASPRFDGIIFPASQTDMDGQNLVLFNRAHEVEPYDIPKGTSQDVLLPGSLFGDEDEEYDDISVSETVPSDPLDELPQSRPNRAQRGPIRLFQDPILDDPDSSGKPTLRLEVDSVKVLKIKGAKYSKDVHTVSWHRQTEEERAAFNQRIGITDDVFDEIFPEEP